VYYELDATPYAVGPRSFVGELLAKAGGDNVVPADLGEFPKVSPELVTAADPEVILGATLEDVARRPGWERITAVRNKRVFSFTPEERAVIVRPGPRLAAGLTALANRLRPGGAP
jgi:iron complex transport system substrate-binding protein